jgi:hypothetical protein
MGRMNSSCLLFSTSDKSIAPYRQCSGRGEVRLPGCRSGAVWIRQFGLNRVGIWQGNCFMGIQYSAAISCRLRHVQKSSDRRAGSDGVQHANCPAKSYYFPATREAGLVQIAKSLVDGRLVFRSRLCDWNSVPCSPAGVGGGSQRPFPLLRTARPISWPVVSASAPRVPSSGPRSAAAVVDCGCCRET